MAPQNVEPQIKWSYFRISDIKSQGNGRSTPLGLQCNGNVSLGCTQGVLFSFPQGWERKESMTLWGSSASLQRSTHRFCFQIPIPVSPGFGVITSVRKLTKLVREFRCRAVWGGGLFLYGCMDRFHIGIHSAATKVLLLS